MDDTKLRFGVGVLVLSAVGVGVILTFLFGAFPAVLARNYVLNIVMESAAGVSQNTPVLRDGVRIGRVTKIELKPEGGVLLMLAIDAAPRLGSTLATLGRGGRKRRSRRVFTDGYFWPWLTSTPCRPPGASCTSPST